MDLYETKGLKEIIEIHIDDENILSHVDYSSWDKLGESKFKENENYYIISTRRPYISFKLNDYDFKKIRTISDVIYQNPGGFVGTNSSLFNSGKATTKEKELAKRVLKGETYFPATNALWFYAPSKNSDCKGTWFNQANTGRYKSHCFYAPKKGVCQELY